MIEPGSNQAQYREQALASLWRLPPFSPILTRLIASMADEDVSFAELAELIEKDTVLAGHVLRLVNSAVYGRRGTINSVRHAISILGLAKLRNLALGLSVCRMWNQVKTPVGWSARQFNLHAVATALMADLIAQRLDVEYPEGAFAAGLLHDLGKLVIAVALPYQYEVIERLSADTDRSGEECEMETIGITHSHLSSAALSHWNLPSPIVAAVAHHHARLGADQGSLPLALVVRAGDEAVNRLGISVRAEGGTPADPAPTFSAIGLASDGLIEEFQAELEALREFF